MEEVEEIEQAYIRNKTEEKKGKDKNVLAEEKNEEDNEWLLANEENK